MSAPKHTAEAGDLLAQLRRQPVSSNGFVGSELEAALDDPSTPTLIHDLAIEMHPDGIRVDCVGEGGRAFISRLIVTFSGDLLGQQQRTSGVRCSPDWGSLTLSSCAFDGALPGGLLTIAAPPHHHLSFGQEASNLWRRGIEIVSRWLRLTPCGEGAS